MKIKSIGKVPKAGDISAEASKKPGEPEKFAEPKEQIKPVIAETPKEPVHTVKETAVNQLSEKSGREDKSYRTVKSDFSKEETKHSKALYYWIGGPVLIILLALSYYYFFYNKTVELKTELTPPIDTLIDSKMKELEKKQKELEQKEKELGSMKSSIDSSKQVEKTRIDENGTESKEEPKVSTTAPKKIKPQIEKTRESPGTNENKGKTTFK